MGQDFDIHIYVHGASLFSSSQFDLVLCLFCGSRRQQGLLPSCASPWPDVAYSLPTSSSSAPPANVCVSPAVNTTINMEYNNNDKVSLDPKEACCLPAWISTCLS